MLARSENRSSDADRRVSENFNDSRLEPSIVLGKQEHRRCSLAGGSIQRGRLVDVILTGY